MVGKAQQPMLRRERVPEVMMVMLGVAGEDGADSELDKSGLTSRSFDTQSSLTYGIIHL